MRSSPAPNVMMHRVILERMGFDMTGYQTDHINGSKLDNRRCNLRRALPHENSYNRVGVNKGYKGVRVASKTSWNANICAGGKQYRLGSYASTHEAAIIYNRAALILHGAFARFNDIAPENHVDTSHVDVQAIINGAVAPRIPQYNHRGSSYPITIKAPLPKSPLVRAILEMPTIKPEPRKFIAFPDISDAIAAIRIHTVVSKVLGSQGIIYTVPASLIQERIGEHGYGWYAPTKLNSSENFYFKSVDAAEQWASRIVRKAA